MNAPDLFETVVFETDLETANNAKLALTGIPMSPEQFDLWTSDQARTRLDYLLSQYHTGVWRPPQRGIQRHLACAAPSVPTVPCVTLGAPTASISHLSAPRLIHRTAVTLHACSSLDFLVVPSTTLLTRRAPSTPFVLQGFSMPMTSMVESALETMVQIIEEDRPLNEALSTSYARVNPFTAKIFNVEPDEPFEDILDPDEWKIASTLPYFPNGTGRCLTQGS